MAIEIVDQEFLHINSTASASPHDLMRRGDVIEIGTPTNPFFRFYETYTRTYSVQNPDGTTAQISAISFLARVKDGSITTSNLPGPALEIGRHFMMLARELVWENIRLNEFPEEPSRHRCVWLLENQDQVRAWLRTLAFPPNTYWIVKVRASGRALNVDSRFLAGDSEPLPVWHDRARRYWRGEMTHNPHPETLFTGTLRVEEIINPTDFVAGT